MYSTWVICTETCIYVFKSCLTHEACHARASHVTHIQDMSRTCESCHAYVRRATHIRSTSHTHELCACGRRVISHVFKSYLAREECHTRSRNVKTDPQKRRISVKKDLLNRRTCLAREVCHTHTSLVIHMWVMSHTYEAYHIDMERIKHIWAVRLQSTCHITYMWCHTYMISHICKSYLTREACHAHVSHVTTHIWGMSHIYELCTWVRRVISHIFKSYLPHETCHTRVSHVTHI